MLNRRKLLGMSAASIASLSIAYSAPALALNDKIYRFGIPESDANEYSNVLLQHVSQGNGRQTSDFEYDPDEVCQGTYRRDKKYEESYGFFVPRGARRVVLDNRGCVVAWRRTNPNDEFVLFGQIRLGPLAAATPHALTTITRRSSRRVFL